MAELEQLLGQPEALPNGAVLYAVRPWTRGTDSVALQRGEAPADHESLLEVDLVLDVLEVWSAQRGGRAPTPEEAAEAVIHSAQREAYLPVS